MSTDVARADQSRTLWLVAAGASLIVLLAAVGVLVWAVTSDAEPEPTGRTAVVLAPADDAAEVDDQALDAVRRGVALLGHPDASVERAGDRITVELPDEAEPGELVARLVRPTTLGIHPVEAVDPTGTPTTTDSPASDAPIVLADVGGEELLRLGRPAVTGPSVDGATAERDLVPGSDAWTVTLDFGDVGETRWREFTADVACEVPGDPKRRIAFVLDGAVLSSPQVDPSVACGVGVTGGSTQIAGDFDEEQARGLVASVAAASLPAPLVVVEERAVTTSPNTAAVVVGLGVVILMAAGTFVACIVFGRRATGSAT